MFSYPNYLILATLAIIALCIDAWLGEARRYHPLVGFGWLTSWLETYLNAPSKQMKPMQRLMGFLGVILLVVPPVLLALWLCHHPSIYMVANIALLYFAIGHKSLHDHANAVLFALKKNEFEKAKLAASYMVSRDSAAIAPIPATIESVLENGNDGVFGTLFWFFIAGGAGALAFRLVNTLDAMWGYKTERYYYFGWAAARLDDAMNYIPARLTAITYALLGHTRVAIQCWKNQAPLWDSPNAGPVMSAGAGALNIQLGGAARYQGEWHMRPALGTTHQPNINDISNALKLVRHGVYLWLAIILLVGFLQNA
jgi:adenosylcobinamide-phosphate synthase